MPTSVRLDSESEALLARLARSRGLTKSAVLRAALLRLAQDEEPTAAAGDGPYSLIADLVGIAQGGPDDLARNHKRAFRDILAGKARR
jgi:hypothetical protein